VAKMAMLHAQRQYDLQYAYHSLQAALILWRRVHCSYTRQLVREAIYRLRVARYRMVNI
jgi:hypothetical protein